MSPEPLEPVPGLERLFAELRTAASNQLFYLSLFAALALPDICAALDSPDGLATGPRYAVWFDKYVGPKYLVGPSREVGFSGSDCYLLRCSMLHQGTTQKPEARFRRYVFVPGTGVHANVFNHVEVNDIVTSFVQFSIPQFCADVADGATEWLHAAMNNSQFQENYSRFMRLYPNGYPPTGTFKLLGGPVIT